jgi:hypothetical protein
MPTPSHRAGEPVRAGIPEHGRVPRYYVVKSRLLALIEELGEGATLPSERELAERFEVSRVTFRQAVSELVLEGRLVRRQGAGTFVAPPKLVQPLALVSYTEGMRSQGVEPSRYLVTGEHMAADDRLAADLGIEPGDPALHIERVLLADSERPGIDLSVRSSFSRSVVRLRSGHVVVRVFDRDGRYHAGTRRGTGGDGARHPTGSAAHRHQSGGADAVAAPRDQRRRRCAGGACPLSLSR